VESNSIQSAPPKKRAGGVGSSDVVAVDADDPPEELDPLPELPAVPPEPAVPPDDELAEPEPPLPPLPDFPLLLVPLVELLPELLRPLEPDEEPPLLPEVLLPDPLLPDEPPPDELPPDDELPEPPLLPAEPLFEAATSGIMADVSGGVYQTAHRRSPDMRSSIARASCACPTLARPALVAFRFN
jgi:hypothetical protein